MISQILREYTVILLLNAPGHCILRRVCMWQWYWVGGGVGGSVMGGPGLEGALFGEKERERYSEPNVHKISHWWS